MKDDYKVRYEEQCELFQQFLSAYDEAYIKVGELQAENEILKGILSKHGLEIPERHTELPFK